MLAPPRLPRALVPPALGGMHWSALLSKEGVNIHPWVQEG